MSNLSSIYESLGRYEESVPLAEQSLELTIKRLGQDHPQTLPSMHRLSALYNNIRRPEGIKLAEECFEARRRVLGEEHPGTLVSMNALALIYANLGRSTEAMEKAEKLSGNQGNSAWTKASQHTAEHERVGSHVQQVWTVRGSNEN
jgi:tetratricopeptide (TPR) repeat protein